MSRPSDGYGGEPLWGAQCREAVPSLLFSFTASPSREGCLHLIVVLDVVWEGNLTFLTKGTSERGPHSPESGCRSLWGFLFLLLWLYLKNGSQSQSRGDADVSR